MPDSCPLPSTLEANAERVSIIGAVELGRVSDVAYIQPASGYTRFASVVRVQTHAVDLPKGKPGTGTKFLKGGEIRANFRFAVHSQTGRSLRLTALAQTGLGEECA